MLTLSFLSVPGCSKQDPECISLHHHACNTPLPLDSITQISKDYKLWCSSWGIYITWINKLSHDISCCLFVSFFPSSFLSFFLSFFLPFSECTFIFVWQTQLFPAFEKLHSSLRNFVHYHNSTVPEHIAE